MTSFRKLPAVPGYLAGMSFSPPSVVDGVTPIDPEDPEACFAAGTTVLMADRSMKAIEEIMVGDRVLARNDKNPDAPLQERTVLEIKHNAPSATYWLIFRCEINGEEMTLRVTPEHPFYTASRGWKSVENLEPGDFCIGPNGERSVLLSKRFDAELIPVYNLEVEEDHTYFVGPTPESCVLVHNEYDTPSVDSNINTVAKDEFKQRILDMVRKNNKANEFKRMNMAFSEDLPYKRETPIPSFNEASVEKLINIFENYISHDMSPETQQKYRDALYEIIDIAQNTPITQMTNQCEQWATDYMNNLKAARKDGQSAAIHYDFARWTYPWVGVSFIDWNLAHVAVEFILPDGSTFCLDQGWWNGIFTAGEHPTTWWIKRN